jgi:N-acetylmuramoyl-L-alanine amidase
LHSHASVARTQHHAAAGNSPTTSHGSVKAAQSHHAKPVTKVARRHISKPHQTATARAQVPTRLADRPLIVIDAGHGGRDPGAIGSSGVTEKTITLETAKELRSTLEKTGRYRVELTRTGDHTVSLAERLAFARKHDADLMIAIHADASRDRRARGASVYVSNRDVTTQFPAGQGSSRRIARALAAPEPQPEPGSAWLQYSMIEQLDDDVRMATAPARQAHLYVLGSRTIPGVLLEMGFLSNRQDEAMLTKPAYRQVLVQAIRDAINDYFATIKDPPART